MAPTNKACRVIGGETIHKFKNSFNITSFKNKRYSYSFIDATSMVQDRFYKFIIYLKRAIPELKSIIVGDFDQLPPVNCRLGHTTFRDSRALYELCDGNQLNLTVCRRSDDTLFNMVAPKNIKK